ncbi:YciI family protein [Amycolatopsis rhabdoformis]|uniref:YciI family protein n=1 Tax=Amycolatopsis rhabdoformis TaxID=1448059 RepID=A0ABZ1IAU4_9PSEU|nr:YciI family protein [Amycolatopsis rhabdoformis]WSE31527.1 YciI family protein [Amycolatopsis rhabdoformis]
MTKYMVIQTYSGGESCDVPMTEWSPEDIRAHVAFQQALNEELTDKGEFVDAQGLAGPEAAKKVVSGGAGGTVVTDGPFAEAKELIAGYRIIDVDSEERALEIAARLSAAPGVGGTPIRQPIEVRQVMSAPA